jgi:hypothetical protein
MCRLPSGRGSRCVPSSIANEGIDMFGGDRSNRSGLGVLRALAPEGRGLKRST